MTLTKIFFSVLCVLLVATVVTLAYVVRDLTRPHFLRNHE